MSEFEISGLDHDEEEEELGASNGLVKTAINSSSPRGNLQKEQRAGTKKCLGSAGLADEGKNKKNILSLDKAKEQKLAQGLNDKKAASLVPESKDKEIVQKQHLGQNTSVQNNLQRQTPAAASNSDSVFDLFSNNSNTKSLGIFSSAERLAYEFIDKSYSAIIAPFELAIKKAEEFGTFLHSLGQKLFSFGANLANRIICACTTVFEKIKNILNRTIRYLEINVDKIDRSPAQHNHLQLQASSLSQTNFFRTTASTILARCLAVGDLDIIKRISDAVKVIAESLLKEFRKQKTEEELAIQARKKELFAEAQNELFKARIMRPDLAGKLEMPQLAFLENSPFAHVPSALDLIQKADKIS
jgi:hypothetical protein